MNAMTGPQLAFQAGVSAGLHGVRQQTLADIITAAGSELDAAHGDKAAAWDALIAGLERSHSIQVEHMKKRFTRAERLQVARADKETA